MRKKEPRVFPVITLLLFLLVTVLSAPVFPEDPWDVDDTNDGTSGDTIIDTTGTTGGEIQGSIGDDSDLPTFNFSGFVFSFSYEITKYFFGQNVIRDDNGVSIRN